MLKIKKGDKVEIIAGKDKGKQGEVVSIFPSNEKVIIKGVNIVVKHIKPKQSGGKGERIEVESPIHISNVMLVCPETKKKTRVGFKVENGNKVRISKKSGKEIQ
jgi:large subunit ribosomal protein L24